MLFKKLMFEKEDVQAARSYLLLRLIRIIFYKMRITHDDFVAKHSEWFARSNIDVSRQNHDKNNLRRNLTDNENLTFRIFKHVIINILYCDLIRISVTIRNRETGEEIVYHSDDPLKDDDVTASPSLENLTHMKIK